MNTESHQKILDSLCLAWKRGKCCEPKNKNLNQKIFKFRQQITQKIHLKRQSRTSSQTISSAKGANRRKI